jgi:hypothetical protein
MIVREPTPLFDWIFRALEKVRERLERSCDALEAAFIPHAMIGGNGLATWVATIDDGAVRNACDVDLFLDLKDLVRATEALLAVAFRRDQVMDMTEFLDGPDGKPLQGIHILPVGRKVKENDVLVTPAVGQTPVIEGVWIVELVELVRMKLNSYQDKSRSHLRDMIQVGLIDIVWPAKFEMQLGERPQTLIDDPDG